MCDEAQLSAEVHFDLSVGEQAMLAQISEPGFWPRQSHEIDEIRAMPFVELKTSGNGSMIRRCSKCEPNTFKPDRAHHCSRLNACILKMDHHCSFANQTIGFRNYKFFMQFMFYAILSCIIFILAMFERFTYTIRPVLDLTFYLHKEAPLFLCYSLMLPILLCLLAFTSFHVFLVLNGMTTIEFREKHGSHNAEIRRRSMIVRHSHCTLYH